MKLQTLAALALALTFSMASQAAEYLCQSGVDGDDYVLAVQTGVRSVVLNHIDGRSVMEAEGKFVKIEQGDNQLLVFGHTNSGETGRFVSFTLKLKKERGIRVREGDIFAGSMVVAEDHERTKVKMTCEVQ